MNENYLNYLSYSGSTMTYPFIPTRIWDDRFISSGPTFYHQVDQVITVDRQDISFMKKEVKKHDFLVKPIDLDFTPTDEGLIRRLYQMFRNSSYGITTFEEPTLTYFDEYH